jgi:pimeloyl-ACP methyl ester carboxylesterase
MLRYADVPVVTAGEPSAPPVVLVHGSGGPAGAVWGDQMGLAEGYRLLAVTRRGWPPGPPGPAGFDVDAYDLAAFLPRLGGAHLVGHSYGGLSALCAAVRNPAPVRSLTLIEPVAFGLVPEHPDVAALLERLLDLFRQARDGELTPTRFAAGFKTAMDPEAPWPRQLPEPPAPLTARDAAFARAMMREAPAWEADPDVSALRSIPVTVVTGGWHPAIEAVAEFLCREAGAHHDIVRGYGHNPQRAPETTGFLGGYWRWADLAVRRTQSPSVRLTDRPNPLAGQAHHL